jgi:hypothetical protein
MGPPGLLRRGIDWFFATLDGKRKDKVVYVKGDDCIGDLD